MEVHQAPLSSCCIHTPVATVTASNDNIVFSEFRTLSEEAVRNIIVSANKKACALDPLPSSLLPVCLDVLLPVITKMVNLSLESGHFAEDWKNALVNPLLKKAGLELINKNFRLISNLQFVSKLTERVVSSDSGLHVSQPPIPGTTICISQAPQHRNRAVESEERLAHEYG